ncbi:oxygenase MpaB family protein [Pelagibacterium sp. 26DY04]|uniref:oxygenase MpaB family protein n=1 Tax=Pelagibacterium sp. 26DY04 TaxID=2967130 RepID=UPI002815B8A7|nr:oxygenase MpaB family protein [Pelagibacterium sp. 26DY04]WMT86575.1 oxygenase MpaB family protein [Pelagibacterium sp. 26DY04]
MVSDAILNRLIGPVGALMQPPEGMAFDYAAPAGAPALVSPDSLSWRLFKNPVSLFVGGVAAVILELAEPSVRSGVWEHSSFRKDAITRLRRTGAAAMMTVYGPREAAEKMIARVVRVHERVVGETPAGISYRANDQRLLDWVQATAGFGFITAYSAFVRPLTPAEQSMAFAEGAGAARLYGALGAPDSLNAWHAMLAQTLPDLEPSPIVFEFLGIMNRALILPAPLRPMQRLMIRAAIDIVPAEVQERLGLEGRGLSAPERSVVRFIARLADRIPILDAPPAQASIRMGRPADFLYRKTGFRH